MEETVKYADWQPPMGHEALLVYQVDVINSGIIGSPEEEDPLPGRGELMDGMPMCVQD